MSWIVRGDIDGFFGLALDNLVQLLLIDALCRGVLGFPAELVYGRILPGAALSLVIGNLYYSWQAMRLARATGRTDVCAQSEEHTSELQSLRHLVCRLLLEITKRQ